MPALHWSVTICDCCNITVAKSETVRCESIHHAADDVCPECIYPIETPDGTKQFCRTCKEKEQL